MTMIQKLKKNKKGFTLVELLVVLVILAILAAAIIPSMMGFIDKAKEESHAAECRSALLATNIQLNERYGLDTLGTDASATMNGDKAVIEALAGVPGAITAIVIDTTTDHPFVASMTYTTSDNVAYNYAQSTNTWTRATA